MKKAIKKINLILFILLFWLSYFTIRFILYPVLYFIKKVIINHGILPKSVLFLENFPEENAGYYYRARVWADMMKDDGLRTRILTPFKHKSKWERIQKENFEYFLLAQIWKRAGHLFISLRYEVVIVRREVLFFNEYGDLFFEKILLSIHPTAILDIDDDLGASKKEPRRITNIVGVLLLENGNKFNNSLKLFKRFIVGSKHLQQLVLKQNPKADIVVIPTCIDFTKSANKQFNSVKKNKINFGWTGMTGNMVLIDPIISVFNQLAKKYNFTLTVISGAPYQPNSPVDFDIINIPWSLEKDQFNISLIDIGLMPLEDNDLTKGKCGFKLIQYMSLGIPSIGQKITVNEEIIPTPEHGWLVKNEQEWLETIEYVLNMSPEELDKVGDKAALHINNYYTFQSNYTKLKQFLIRLS